MNSRLLITGNASGLGAAITVNALARGHHVVGIDRQPAPSQQVAGLTAHHPVDLADLDAAQAATRAAIDTLGGLDAVVLCAGINRPGRFGTASMQVWRSILEVNLVGNVAVAHAALPALLDSRGTLLAIGSTLSRKGAENQTGYAASKFGLAGFMQSLAIENRNAIRITTVHPGAMDTGFFDGRPSELRPPPGTAMDPDHVADAVLFCLTRPPGTVVRDLFLTDTAAQDWP